MTLGRKQPTPPPADAVKPEPPPAPPSPVPHMRVELVQVRGQLLTKEQADELVAAPRWESGVDWASGPDRTVLMPPEVCQVAALQMPDGYLVFGHRYADCFRAAAQRFNPPAQGSSPIVQSLPLGFLTSRGRFVDAREGLALQRAAGIPSVMAESRRQTHGAIDDLGYFPHVGLTSEDLY